MRELVEIVCFLGVHEHSFRAHDETEQSANRGNYKDLCSYLAARDPAFNEFITSNQAFKGTSATFQNELIEVIRNIIIDHIAQEVKEAEFVTVLADETTDVSRKAQLAISLRYVARNGALSAITVTIS